VAYFVTLLEISLTAFVAAIAIKFDCVAGAFARRAAVFSAFLWRARTRWVLAFFFVSHLLLSYEFLLEKLPVRGEAKLNTIVASIGKGDLPKLSHHR